jgi:hypothetical protein
VALNEGAVVLAEESMVILVCNRNLIKRDVVCVARKRIGVI